MHEQLHPRNWKNARLGWRLIAGIAMAAVLAAAILVACTPPESRRMSPEPPLAQDRATGLDADLVWLRRMPAVDGSFSADEQRRFETEIDALRSKAIRMDRAALHMAVAHAVALAENGHSNAHGEAWGKGASALPLRVAWFGTDLYVVKARPGHRRLLGAKVVEIEGQAPTAMASAMSAYVGGTSIYKWQATPYLLVQPAALHAAGRAQLPDALHMAFEIAGGRRVSEIIDAVPGPIVTGAETIVPQRHLSPRPIEGETGPWSHILDGRELPLYLAHRDYNYWRIWLPARNALYLQINRSRSQGKLALDAFLAAVLKEIADKRPPRVIVDLRFNIGGDMSLTGDFARKVRATLPNAQLDVITGSDTFSAAIVFAAQLKALGNAVLTGNPVGDDLRFWSEGKTVHLRNLDLDVRYSTAMHDWARGCGLLDLFRCYRPNYRDGVAVGTLAPDKPVSLDWDDYIAGRDPVLKAIGIE